MKFWVALITVALVLSAGACARQRMMRQSSRQHQQQVGAAGGEQQAQAQERQTATRESAGEVASGVTVKEEPQYGAYLADEQGRALYLFTPDEFARASTCYDECAEAWPPALAEGQPDAQHPSVRDDALGTVRRSDGTTQLTYNGWPLYYYRRDQNAGRVTGQDVDSFGGEWYLVAPEGQKVEERETD